MSSENQEPTSADAIGHQEAADRLVDDWAALKGWGVNQVVDPSGARGTEVLRAVHERVPDSVLVDAVGRTADGTLTEVVNSLGAPFRTPGGWSRRLPKKPTRLILVARADLVGRTRTSGEPQRLLRALSYLGSLGHTVFVTVRDAGSGHETSHTLRIAAEPPVLDDVPVEVRALALAEARHVPYAIWQELVAGLTGQRPEADHLARVAEQQSGLVVDAAGEAAVSVSFRDETEARLLRELIPAEDRARTHHHLADQLVGSPGAYATTALAAHCAAADLAAGDTTYPRFTGLLRRIHTVAHIAPETLIEAAEGAGLEEAPGGSVLADAVHARHYALLPCDQPTWVSWLHFQATVRGDTELAGELADCGIPLPWRVSWSRWCPPAALHLSYLGGCPGVSDLVELRLHDRPVVAAFGYRGRQRRGTLHEPRSGEVLDTVDWELEQQPEEVLPGLRWPTAGGEDDRPYPDPLNTALLDAGPVTVDDTVVIGGQNGLFGIKPAPGTPFAGITHWPGGRVEAACPTVLRAPGTVPRHGPAPQPADLDGIFEEEGGTLISVPSPLLPDGLTHSATRDFLVDQGIPSFRDLSGLGFYGRERDSDWWGVHHGTHTGPLPPLPERLLREIEWSGSVTGGHPGDPATPSGPYFRIGQWMGDDVVIDGPTGQILHLPDPESDRPGRAEIVGRSLHDFLAMVSVWLLGVSVFTASGDRIETREIASRVKSLQSTIDPVGAAAGIWGVALMDH
ncbi:SUKH-4 family immunity protein [Streptomyces sp. NPDC046716]|uniref:SUKH-4 family immunity protein n=1 Tax=Streptomyces sp. NPDC046716 TaxID=3157093 RepID=UPI003406F8F1